MSEPNYPVIELEAKLDESKDEIIKLQKSIIEKLQGEVEYLKSLITNAEYRNSERDVSSHTIAPSNFKPKSHIRTLSEVGVMLERRSLELGNFKKSAEDIEDEV